MKILGIYCPYCGGNIKFDIESGKKSCFCVHCGQQIILDDEVIRSEHIEIKRDEARIKEAEIKREIKMRELDIQSKDNTFHSILKWFWLVITLILIIITVLILFFGGDKSASGWEYGVLFAGYIAAPISGALGYAAFKKK